MRVSWLLRGGSDPGSLPVCRDPARLAAEVVQNGAGELQGRACEGHELPTAVLLFLFLLHLPVLESFSAGGRDAGHEAFPHEGYREVISGTMPARGH